jgi:hypothetical protein
MVQVASRRPLTAKVGFDPASVHVRLVVDTVALGRVFLPALRFSPLSIIPPMFRPHPPLKTTLARWTNGRSLGTLNKMCCFGHRGGTKWG